MPRLASAILHQPMRKERNGGTDVAELDLAEVFRALARATDEISLMAWSRRAARPSRRWFGRAQAGGPLAKVIVAVRD